MAEGFGGPLASDGLRQARNAAHVGDELGRIHVEREAVVLGHVADSFANLEALRRDVEIEDASAAVGRGEDTEEDLDERALARAVGSDEAGDARFDMKVQRVQSSDWPESHGEIGGLDDRHAAMLPHGPERTCLGGSQPDVRRLRYGAHQSGGRRHEP